MKKATVNLTGCKSVDDMHRRFQQACGFPDYYGKNPDAFWDCINRECGVDFITIVGSNGMADEIQPALQSLVKLLEENKRYWASRNSEFDYEVVNE